MYVLYTNVTLLYKYDYKQHFKCLNNLFLESKTLAHFAHVLLSTVVRSMSLVIISLNRRKSCLPKTFVIMSARCSAVEIGFISIVPCSTCSRRKWWRMSIFFVRLSAVTFVAIFNVDLLSSYTPAPASENILLIRVKCCAWSATPDQS